VPEIKAKFKDSIMNKQTGFTLIELAIVLVIIGLLLGGVLKGQELINSAKVKNMASDFRNAQIYIYGYQDRFHALPGDDWSAATHVTGATNPSTGTQSQNGVIEGAWNTSNSTDESCVFWNHVRVAGYAPGPTLVNCGAGNTYQPRNADGGIFGVQSAGAAFTMIASNAAGTAGTAMAGGYVACSQGILGKFAKQLDAAMDDGDTDAGAMRATDAAGATGMSIPSASVDDSTTYIVCLGF
jgi:prepilin-type N-terminal cleavage/methylation domain-containing protein